MSDKGNLWIWIWRGYLTGLAVVLLSLYIEDWGTTQKMLGKLYVLYLIIITGLWWFAQAGHKEWADPMLGRAVTWGSVVMLHLMMLFQFWP